MNSFLFNVCVILLFIGMCTCRSDRVREIVRLKKAVLRERTRQVELAREQCSMEPQNVATNNFLHSLDDLEDSNEVLQSERTRRSTNDPQSGKALVLTRNQKGTMLLNSVSESQEAQAESDSFTLDVWLKPEGGQEYPANIIGAVDRCSPFEEGWILGIGASGEGEKEPHYFAKLQVTHSTWESVLTSPTKLRANKWTHIALTYDGQQAVLYINGARVSRNDQQKGPVFRSKDRVGFLQTCRVLQLGGGYRGALTNLRVWKRALTDKEVRDKSLSDKGEVYPDVVVWEDFESDEKWEWENGQFSPLVVPNVIDPKPYSLKPEKTPCSLTICDAQEVILSYAANWQLRTPKTLRYQVVNVRNSDGSNGTVHPAQIATQHKALKEAFKPYNISWELSELSVLNSSLRQRTILFGCLPQQVGDGVCNEECSRQEITRNDGGDCDRTKSKCDVLSQFGNGQCDPECNTVYNDWDGGDCCNPDITDTAMTCVDPDSSDRAFLDVEELKSLLKLPSDEQLNIFFAHRTNQDISGLATFPWEKQVFTELGGIVIRPEDFGVEGRTDTLIHEIGHTLGLWHVHRGVSEFSCGHPCFESLPSMTEGDLCEDTRPTVAHSACRDPPSNRHVCGFGPFKATPYQNYMSYADDECTSHFTKQQVARMHCYIDLSYPTWVDQHIKHFQPPAPPLAPTVIDYKDNHLTLAWISPLNEALYLDDAGSCSKCNCERALVQYAISAKGTASHFERGWQPSQATGPPDAETCYPSPKSWMPNPTFCSPGVQDSDPEGCSLSITFAVPTVPHSLSIWLSWNARQGLADVVLQFADGTTESLGPVATTCDQKFSVILSQMWPWLSDAGDEKAVTGIILTTVNALVAIDSVQLVSRPNHQACYKCKPLRYRIHRKPAFLVNHRSTGHIETEDLEFIDKTVVEGTTYRYSVQAFFGNQISHMSPSVIFQPTQFYCGDKIVQKPREQCDDGNLLNGDGCSNRCLVENGFHCTGSPSICYWHKGDGICELYERNTVVEDCGYITPSGFEDQWASSVNTIQELHSPSCPLNVIVGPPNASQKTCNKDTDSALSWKPCMANLDDSDNYYFEAFFSKPVVVSAVILYLGSDGRTQLSREEFKRTEEKENNYNYISEPSVSLDLIDADGRLYPIGSSPISCTANPITIPVMQDLSRPFYLSHAVRVTFTSPETAFSAVRLRSIKHFNPIEVRRCSEAPGKTLYNPELEQCVAYPGCHRPLCKDTQLIKNGRLICTGKEEGDTCKVLCDEGYFHRTDLFNEIENKALPVLTCKDGSWVGKDLSCRPTDCHLPKIPHADSVCPDGTTLGRNCTFKCRPPARMRPIGVVSGNGNGGATSVVSCTKEGVWSDSDSYCLLTCPIPVAPDHSVMTDSGWAKQKYFGFGQSYKFRCKAGYHVAGKSIRSRILQLKCNSSGIWSGPACVPVTCNELDSSDGGVFDCTDGNNAGSVCTKVCLVNKLKKRRRKISDKDLTNGSEGFETETSSSRCGVDGQWQQSFNICGPLAESCPMPKINDPALRYDCHNSDYSQSMNIGSVCRVACLQSDQEPMVHREGQTGPTLTFLSNSSLTCTGQGRWFPDSSKIQCFPKCNKGFIGDGYCDAANNQEKCSWDGGDCCQSTVRGNIVVPFPSNCLEPCRCLDPSAA